MKRKFYKKNFFCFGFGLHLSFLLITCYVTITVVINISPPNIYGKKKKRLGLIDLKVP